MATEVVARQKGMRDDSVEQMRKMVADLASTPADIRQAIPKQWDVHLQRYLRQIRIMLADRDGLTVVRQRILNLDPTSPSLFIDVNQLIVGHDYYSYLFTGPFQHAVAGVSTFEVWKQLYHPDRTAKLLGELARLAEEDFRKFQVQEGEVFEYDPDQSQLSPVAVSCVDELTRQAMQESFQALATVARERLSGAQHLYSTPLAGDEGLPAPLTCVWVELGRLLSNEKLEETDILDGDAGLGKRWRGTFLKGTPDKPVPKRLVDIEKARQVVDSYLRQVRWLVAFDRFAAPATPWLKALRQLEVGLLKLQSEMTGDSADATASPGAALPRLRSEGRDATRPSVDNRAQPKFEDPLASEIQEIVARYERPEVCAVQGMEEVLMVIRQTSQRLEARQRTDSGSAQVQPDLIQTLVDKCLLPLDRIHSYGDGLTPEAANTVRQLRNALFEIGKRGGLKELNMNLINKKMGDLPLEVQDGIEFEAAWDPDTVRMKRVKKVTLPGYQCAGMVRKARVELGW